MVGGGTEEGMCQTIVDMVEEKLQTRQFSAAFNIFYNRLPRIDFPTLSAGVQQYVQDQQLALPDRISFKIGQKTNVHTATSTVAVPGGTKVTEIVTQTIEYMPQNPTSKPAKISLRRA